MLSDKLASFEEAFDVLNKAFFESALSKTVVTISPTPSAYGHFTPWKSWAGPGEERMCEINLGSETIDRPIIECMATLLHEMVHQYCYENDIQDTSRGGTYHNKRFRDEAEKRGLSISYDKRIGWSVTRPGNLLVQLEARGVFREVERELHRIGGARIRAGADEGGKKQSSTRKYVCPECGMSVRATREVRIACIECDRELEVA